METRVAAPINYIEIVDGDPRITGTRMKVAFIGNLIVRLGETVESVIRAYGLTYSQVHAALAYYYDHKQALDDWLDQPVSEEILEEARRHRADLLARHERMKAEKAQERTDTPEGNE